MVFAKFATLFAAVAVASASATPRVDSSVHRALRQEGTVNLIVTMKASTAAPLSEVQEASFISRGAKIEALVNKLNQHAATSQSALDAVFAQESTSSTPLFTKQQTFWVSNQRYIENASPELVSKLLTIPSIAEMHAERKFKIPTVFPASSGNESSHVMANEWGVNIINAPTIWAGGNRGQGVIVSSIDTGVLGTHEALKGNFRGAYGWFDPEAKKAAPYDGNGHGSHTMGTIAGANGIGVAPGATWMTCKGCRTDDCPEADLLACAQFITCPTDTNGNNKDCSKAPHVVSNSWGGGQGDAWYQASVDAWHAAGIIPVFANGNDGPACTTVSSPGDYANVIGVGATDSSDGLASFSSKGPSTKGLLKPEVSAPGNNVRSSWNTGNSAYNTISGTSMATPHVSGVVALLLAAQPGLKFSQVRDALIRGVDTATLKSAKQTCGGTVDGNFPNNNFGYGRVNAAKVTGSSPSPTSAPTPAPTTKAPSPPAPAPTTKAPAPAPTTKAPTPKPTTKAPITPCDALGRSACLARDDCDWSWWSGCSSF